VQVAELHDRHEMSYVDHIALSLDGAHALTGSRDGAARIWNMTTGARVATLQVSRSPYSPRGAFSPDGALVVTCGGGAVRLWDAASGSEIGTLGNGELDAENVAFSSDGALLLTRYLSESRRVWDVATRTEIAMPRRPGRENTIIDDVVFSPDGSLLMFFRSGPPQRWEPTTGAVVELGALGAVRGCIALSPDGARILTHATANAVAIRDLATGTEVMLRGHQGPIAAAVFSPDGKRILTGSADWTARLWDAATGAEMAVLSAYPYKDYRLAQDFSREVKTVAFSPDGACALTGYGDGATRLWDIAWSMALDDDRTVLLAAALDCGLGRRIADEAANVLMQDAPQDLHAALLEGMSSEQRARVTETSRVLRAPRHPNCYLAPSQRGAAGSAPQRTIRSAFAPDTIERAAHETSATGAMRKKVESPAGMGRFAETPPPLVREMEAASAVEAAPSAMGPKAAARIAARAVAPVVAPPQREPEAVPSESTDVGAPSQAKQRRAWLGWMLVLIFLLAAAFAFAVIWGPQLGFAAVQEAMPIGSQQILSAERKA
jgi:hypothetical protein